MTANKTEDESRGLVFNIQKFSLHDGAGIRTLVFLKGCPLSCVWCSNPEGQSYSPELFYNAQKCIGFDECDACAKACRPGAIHGGDDNRAEINRELCDNCAKCADVCPSKALEISGTIMSVDDVIKVVEEDSAFYSRSGGGLTLSGGEPLSQAGFVLNLLKTAGRRGIDAAVETSGVSKWETLKSAAPLVSRIFFDIKCIDPEMHRKYAGVSNELILENFKKLRSHFPDLNIVVRTPVIPGINDTEDEIKSIVDFIKSAGSASEYELLPYHKFGESKYQRLGKKREMDDVDPPGEEYMKALMKIAGNTAADKPE